MGYFGFILVLFRFYFDFGFDSVSTMPQIYLNSASTLPFSKFAVLFSVNSWIYYGFTSILLKFCMKFTSIYLSFAWNLHEICMNPIENRVSFYLWIDNCTIGPIQLKYSNPSSNDFQPISNPSLTNLQPIHQTISFISVSISRRFMTNKPKKSHPI